MDEQSFEDGKLSKRNIIKPNMKITKTAGTTNTGIVPMAPKNQRRHIAELDKDTSLDNIPPIEELQVPKSRKTSSGKTAEPCNMQINVFLSTVDNYYYLCSRISRLAHSNHYKLPNTCIPLNESHLEPEDLSMLQNMFNKRISPSSIAEVMVDMKGKYETHIAPKTLSNIRAKTQNLIDASLGYTADMNDADKTLLKLIE